ncbi:hypothetical protein [Opitutus sp. ER46]|uniref:hypothetical protein n=1 Tax=Opitutus sp. ER46 TaxID=2161864 RepID=UPI000D308651|nr:hypothetical protein [Opitutus sp. ER46]PTX95489.1 hypothetical protein DB354_08665 [Opitutus sp. ER46]
MRRSHQVALVLLGTAGVVGVAMVWDAARRQRTESTATASLPPGEPVSADRTYSNNEFVPGVGYYHAPYHAWFPYPYNHHDPARGYFAGGAWQAVPWIAALTQSRPAAPAVSSALAAQQAYAQKRRDDPPRAQAGGGSSGFTSRPAGTRAPTSRPIFRGGFGSSAHPSGS